MTENESRPAFLPPPYDTPDMLPPPGTDVHGNTRYGDIEYAFVLGYRPIRMDVTVPAGATGPVPVVVFIHGGAFMLGSRLRGPVSAPIWRSLLARGMAVAAVEYRLSGEALFPALLHDVKAAVRWLRRFGPDLGLRPDAIGVWGESAGGYLSAFLGLNNQDADLNGEVGVTGVSSDVRAAVVWYPPTDLPRMDEQSPDFSLESHDAAGSPESKLIGGALQANRQAAAYASPISHVNRGAAPMLLMHGTHDANVPHLQSVTFKAALDAAGAAEVRLELIPGAEHVFANVDRTPIIRTSADFLAAHLL